MRDYALDMWQRAQQAVETAQADLRSGDADAAASRAYYAAFYAVSALLALEGRSFTRHAAVEAALHRDLVKPGRLPDPVGADYRSLRTLRQTGDYGGLEHVTSDQAQEAVRAARRVIEAVRCARAELQTDA